jgi:hypothetical protein
VVLKLACSQLEDLIDVGGLAAARPRGGQPREMAARIWRREQEAPSVLAAASRCRTAWCRALRWRRAGHAGPPARAHDTRTAAGRSRLVACGARAGAEPRPHRAHRAPGRLRRLRRAARSDHRRRALCRSSRRSRPLW